MVNGYRRLADHDPNERRYDIDTFRTTRLIASTEGEVFEEPIHFTPAALAVADDYIGTYEWSTRGNDWRIGFGASSFLLAEGSGWSRDFGLALFEALNKVGKPHG